MTGHHVTVPCHYKSCLHTDIVAGQVFYSRCRNGLDFFHLLLVYFLYNSASPHRTDAVMGDEPFHPILDPRLITETPPSQSPILRSYVSFPYPHPITPCLLTVKKKKKRKKKVHGIHLASNYFEWSARCSVYEIKKKWSIDQEKKPSNWPCPISQMYAIIPASILRISTSGRHRPVSYPDGPMAARYRFTSDWDPG